MYKSGHICVICGNGKFKKRMVDEKFIYKGKELIVPNYCIYECDKCNEALVDPKTIRSTEKVLTDFRRETDGLLTSECIVAIRKKLGKTQEKMAEILGVGKKNFARYENGKVTQSKAMDILLRLLDKDPAILNTFRPGLWPETKDVTKNQVSWEKFENSTPIFYASVTTQSSIQLGITQGYAQWGTIDQSKVLESGADVEGLSLVNYGFYDPKPIDKEEALVA